MVYWLIYHSPKPIKTLELLYTMIQFLIIKIIPVLDVFPLIAEIVLVFLSDFISDFNLSLCGLKFLLSQASTFVFLDSEYRFGT